MAPTNHYNHDHVDDNPPSAILDDFLFLGDAYNANSMSQLTKYGISRIVSVTTNREFGEHEGIYQIFLSIRDAEDEDISIFFLPACEFIEQARMDGQRVLVHCMAGRSRSASLVLAFLMRMERMSLHDAFLLTKRRRPLVFPNVGFWEHLMEEERKLFGSNSEVPSGYEVAMEIRSGVRKLSPEMLLKKYITAASLEDSRHLENQKSRVVDEWPCGWPATKCINNIFTASIEHLRSDARVLAVEFISNLLKRDRFTRAEVEEGFELLKSTDLADMRIDVPKVDTYLEEMFEQARIHELFAPKV